ncbi:TrkA family potassium uptake protein [Marimonas sp. MJW-29]|uniref:TrkA family potassium uptake protein n=1 Tax=Sulfitobacter sediminis TaxID=3234186 RepID=A0ABV3RMH4_9RHOB
MASSEQTFVVVGLGTFGSTVAQDLVRYGNHVIGVDMDKGRVMALADVLNQTLIIDARDDAALREAGLDSCDTGLVAIGSDIEASILTTMNLRTIGLKKIWAKATSKNHHRILSKLKVERVIHPEKEVGQQIAQILNNPLIRDYVSLGNGQYVVTFVLPEKLEGKALGDLRHRDDFDLRCVGLTRGTEFLGQDGSDVTLQAGDLLLLLGERKNLRAFAGSL